MKLPITSLNKVDNPLKGFAFAFIDEEDKKLKIKKHDSIIEFNNDLSDIQLLDLTDYTSFEVFAHDYDIPVGECEELGGYVNNIISASMECRFVIRSVKSPDVQDTLIDWGDGSINNISTYIEDTNDNDSEFISLLYHCYEKVGKYTIKIYGKDYFSFCQPAAYTKWKPLINSNILCRIFEKDLPVASHIKNLSSAAHTSLRLLNLNVGYSLDKMYMAYTFKNCSNLLNANGLSGTRYPLSVYDTFSGCTSLITSDLRLPSFNYDTTNVINGTYAFCAKLKMNVEDLLPPNGFFGKTINIQNTFVNCKLLGGTINSDYLWNDKNITFVNTDKTFKGCSTSLRDQVPISWGGNASDDIIEQ